MYFNYGFNPYRRFNHRRVYPGFGGIRPGIIFPAPLPFVFVLPL